MVMNIFVMIGAFHVFIHVSDGSVHVNLMMLITYMPPKMFVYDCSLVTYALHVCTLVVAAPANGHSVVDHLFANCPSLIHQLPLARLPVTGLCSAAAGLPIARTALTDNAP